MESPNKKKKEETKRKINEIDDVEDMERVVNYNESIFLILV